MRRLWFFALWMATAALASAQVPTEPVGYGAGIAYGAITPEISTVNVSNSPVGATNATGNNLAGARNSSIGNVPGLSYGSISVPLYLQPFPTALVPYASQETDISTAAPLRVAGLTGSIQSPSAYSNGASPLAAAARAQRGARQSTRRPTYTNADLQRLGGEFERAASLPLSTAQRTVSAESEAAQVIHDRNLGVRTAPPAPRSKPPAE